MADPESIRQFRAPFSTWLGVVLLFSIFGMIVLAVIGPSPRGDNYEEKRAKAREEKLKTAREEDSKALTGYAWIDKNKGTVRIPIEHAMELTVAELAQKKPAPAGPIATPEPSVGKVAAGGATAASPVPATSPSASGTRRPTSVSGPGSEAHNQPAGAVNPAAAPPRTQPGASATPAASAQPNPPAATQTTPPPPLAASPLPVRGKETPTPTPAPQ